MVSSQPAAATSDEEVLRQLALHGITRAFAEAQLRSLSSPAYLATPGTHGGFLLMHATGNHPKNSEIDVPINYGDYYFLEALIRARGKK